MAGKKWDVFSFGDVNVDLIVPNADRIPEAGSEVYVDSMDLFTGGGAALFAMGCARLGLKTVFKGTVGDDLFGRFIRDDFKKLKLDDSLFIADKNQKTGISISFTDQADRSFLTFRGTNATLDLSAIDMRQVNQSRHIHITAYTVESDFESYLAFLKRVKDETDVTVSFDLGWDAGGDWSDKIYELFPMIDILFMNETEAVHYAHTDTALEAARIFSENCGLVVIKLGKSGSLALKDKKVYRMNSFPVKTVDTTGAGDSFNAGFIYGYLHGKSVEECLMYGNSTGALSVTAFGGNTAFPDENELMSFIGSRGEENN